MQLKNSGDTSSHESLVKKAEAVHLLVVLNVDVMTLGGIGPSLRGNHEPSPIFQTIFN